MILNIFSFPALESHRDSLERISSEIKQIGAKITYLPDNNEAASNQNQTLGVLEELRYDLAVKSDRTADKIKGNLQDLEKSIDTRLEQITKSIGDSDVLSEAIATNVAKSYEQLRGDVQALGKVEKVMIQTADNVMDTKRRVEYGVHQILLEVGDLIKIHNKELNSSINTR